MKIQMIEISGLNIDPSYQRALDERRVARTAKAFSLGAVKAISVSRRDCGKMYVYDGQHTVAAARMQGIDRLPAVIVDGDQKREAQWFLAINGGSAKRVSQRQIQKAGVVAGDELSAMAQEILASYSIQISNGGSIAGSTNAIAAIKRYLILSPTHLRSAMDAINFLWRDDPWAWSGVILRGMFEIARDDSLSLLPDVVKACRRKKIVPRRVMDVASAMQLASSGGSGGGAGHAKAAILKLCDLKVKRQ